MAEPTSLEEARRRLQEAQQGRAEALSMRPTTRRIARQAEELLAENHFTARVRRTFQ